MFLYLIKATEKSFTMRLAMNYISRHQFVSPSQDGPDLVQRTPQQYHAARSNPGKPVKDRSQMELDPLVDTVVNMSLVDSSKKRDANMRNFILRSDRDVKIVDYNSENNSKVISTGTSKLNTLCFTDGMGVCNALAIAGEKMHDGLPGKGAKVRIFHVFPDNVEVEKTISAYIEKIRSQGLVVKAAAYGGDADDEDSMNVANNLRGLLKKMNVNVEFDEMCDKRLSDDAPLGVAIGDDHSAQFVTKLEFKHDGKK
jgi:hypothetical protein